MMETDVTPIAAPICCNVAVNPEAIPTSSGFTFSNTKFSIGVIIMPCVKPTNNKKGIINVVFLGVIK